MSDREALAAAVDSLDGDEAVIYAAACERLAQLPEKCATRHYYDGLHREDCPSCHGSDKVYPAELVERIAKAMHDSLTPVAVTWDQQTEGVREVYRVKAVAVLDALNGDADQVGEPG